MLRNKILPALRRGSLAASLFSGMLFAAPPADLQRFTLEDLLSVEPIGRTALSPDGKTFAIVREGQIQLLPSDSRGWPIALTSTTGAKTDLSWSPNGRQIAYASQGSIWVVPAAGGQPQRLTDSPPGPGDPRQAGDHNPQWSPGGKWILFESGGGATVTCSL